MHYFVVKFELKKFVNTFISVSQEIIHHVKHIRVVLQEEILNLEQVCKTLVRDEEYSDQRDEDTSDKGLRKHKAIFHSFESHHDKIWGQDS